MGELLLLALGLAAVAAAESWARRRRRPAPPATQGQLRMDALNRHRAAFHPHELAARAALGLRIQQRLAWSPVPRHRALVPVPKE